jgi:hypothetical protein
LRVEKIQIVVSVELRDDLPRLLDGSLSAAARELNGKVIRPAQLPPKLPPELPRLLMQAPNVVVQVGLNRVEMVLRPPSHVSGTVRSSVQYFQAVLNSSFKATLSHISANAWIGIVLTLEYPLPNLRPSASNGIKPIARQLINLPTHPDELSSFKLQYGFKHGRFFRHFVITGYETREWIQESQSPEAVNQISPPKDAPVIESGVQLALDINNKASPERKTTLVELPLILEELTTFEESIWDFLGINLTK